MQAMWFHRFLRALLAVALLSGLSGCVTPQVGDLGQDPYWELPDEDLNVPAPPRPGLERDNPRKETTRPERVAPAKPDQPAAESGKAESQGRGWWPFGKGKADRPDAGTDVPAPPAAVPGNGGATIAPPPVPPPAESSIKSVVAYRLQAGDALIVKITGPEQHVVEDQIDERGNISLPHIADPVNIEGKTGSEVETFVQDLYINKKKIFRHCSVTVIVPGRFYTIAGEINRTGRYPISPGLTLIRAIAIAGDFTNWAKDKELVLTRRGVRQTINYRELRDNQDLDIIIEPGDYIFVPRSRL